MRGAVLLLLAGRAVAYSWTPVSNAHMAVNLVEGFGYGTRFDDGNYKEVLARLAIPPGGRYPGGTFAMFFNSTRGGWVDGCRTTLRALGMRVRGCGELGRSTSEERGFYGVDMHDAGTFAASRYTDSLGVPTTWVLNVLTSDNVGRDIDTCLAASAPDNATGSTPTLLRFEIGNEMYYQQPFGHVAPNADWYRVKANAVIAQLALRTHLRAAAGITLDINGEPFTVLDAVGAPFERAQHEEATAWNRGLLPLTSDTSIPTSAVIHLNCAANQVTRALVRDLSSERRDLWPTYAAAEPEVMLDSFADTAASQLGTTLWLTEFDAGGCVLGDWLAARFVKKSAANGIGAIRYLTTLLVSMSRGNVVEVSLGFGVAFGGARLVDASVAGKVDTGTGAWPAARDVRLNAIGQLRATVGSALCNLAGACDSLDTLEAMRMDLKSAALPFSMGRPDGRRVLPACLFAVAFRRKGKPDARAVVIIINRCPVSQSWSLPRGMSSAHGEVYDARPSALSSEWDVLPQSYVRFTWNATTARAPPLSVTVVAAAGHL